MIHLGIVIARPHAWVIAIGLAVAATQLHHRVVIFAMDQALDGSQLPNDALWQQLTSSGAELICCGTSADDYGTSSRLPADTRIGSQLDHARLVQTAHRLVALT